MNSVGADMSNEMDYSHMTNMLLVIKEEPGISADDILYMEMESNENSRTMSMTSVKEEPSVMEESANEHVLMNNFDNNVGEDSELDKPFCFETDHMALKNNKDYQHLLRAMLILGAQRTTAIKDLDTLLALKKAAMADPIQFVQKLQSRVDMGIPRAQKIASLPNIAWDKYTSDVDAALNMAAVGRGGSAPLTRNKIKTLLSNSIKEDPEPVASSAEVSQSATASQSMEDTEDGTEAGIKNKSLTFNVRWSMDEQKRFEHLLKKYPQERNQTKRHEKIARELGTRTTVQVASHIQKYFKKLAEWKLPVPGPMPHLTARRRNRGQGSRGRQRQRYCELFAPSSTFLASYELPVCMSEDEYEDTYPGATTYMGLRGDSAVTSETRYESSEDDDDGDEFDDDHIPQYLKNSAEYLELKLLKNVKRDFEDDKPGVHSAGVTLTCSVCGEKLAGVSWRCVECPLLQSVQFCSACSKIEFKSGSHISSHLLEKVDVSLVGAAAVDQDYSYSAAETYSYLDPNYLSKKVAAVKL